MEYNSTVVESQPDWVSATAHDASTLWELANLASRLSEREQEAGNLNRPWRLLGYSGWHCGRVSCGRRDTEGLLQLSGQLAADHLCAVLATGATITRLDLQATVRYTPSLGSLAADLYDAYRFWQPRKGKKATGRLVTDSEGGSTLYVGARGNDWFVRLYNKAAERAAARDSDGQRRYADCWRWECETGNEIAARLAASYCAAAARHTLCTGVMHDWAAVRGWGHFVPVGAYELQPGHSTSRSDVDTTLRWLDTQVRPALERLIAQGCSERVASVLGLETLWLQARRQSERAEAWKGFAAREGSIV